MPVCSSCKKEHEGEHKTCDHCLSVIKAWRNKNKETVKATLKRYYEKNREQKIAYAIKKDEEYGPEYRAARRKKWYDKHKETHKQNCMQWAAEHREQVRIIEKRWRKANPKKIAIFQRTRRVRLAANRTEKITPEQIQKLDELQNHRDFYTDEPLEEPSWDHVIPISQGGSHSITNIVLTNRSTNLQKSARSAEQFLASLVSSHKITNADAIRKLEYLDNISRMTVNLS